VKHFFQQANERIHPSIRNLFISIENDHEKLTRNSLAMARKLNNSEVDLRAEGKPEEGRLGGLDVSVKIEEF
jgi:hypothetical protein